MHYAIEHRDNAMTYLKTDKTFTGKNIFKWATTKITRSNKVANCDVNWYQRKDPCLNPSMNLVAFILFQFSTIISLLFIFRIAVTPEKTLNPVYKTLLEPSIIFRIVVTRGKNLNPVSKTLLEPLIFHPKETLTHTQPRTPSFPTEFLLI